MKVAITVGLKQGVLDPEAAAIKTALNKDGYQAVSSIKRTRTFEIEMTIEDREQALAAGEEMAKSLLANTVIENYDVVLKD